MKKLKAKIKPKTKAKVMGRPSKFDTTNLEHVSKLYLRGFTDHEVADFFKISESTLNLWKIAHPEFSESIKDWKKAADDRVERSLYERAVGYTHESEQVFCYLGKIKRAKTLKHYPPSEIAGFFWMKNRRPEQWRETPPPATDPRFVDAELIFPGVPNQKNAASEKEFAQYYDQN